MLKHIEGFDVYGGLNTDIRALLTSYNFSTITRAIARTDTRAFTGFSCDILQGRMFNQFSGTFGIVGFAAKFSPTTDVKATPLLGLNYDPGTGAPAERRNATFVWNDLGEITLYTGPVAGRAEDNGVYFTSTQGLDLINATLPQARSPIQTLVPGAWHYFEIKYSATAIQVRVDGRVVIDYTGDCLAPITGGGGNTNIIEFNPIVNFLGTGIVLFDDMYVLDSIGSSHSTFEGDISIVSCFPNSDAGPNDMTQFGGAIGHYTTQREAISDGDNSYVTSNISGAKEMYGMTDLPGAVFDVLAVSLQVRARKDTTGPASINILGKVSGTTATSDNIPLASTYSTKEFILGQQPNGAAWTKATANALQIGFNVV